MVLDYLKHFFSFNSSSNEISFDEQRLLTLVTNSRKVFDDSAILKRISLLKRCKQVISVADFGAGSRTVKVPERKVCEIVRHVSIQPKFGQLYADIIKEFNIKSCIELGTSFGIGTAYLAQFSSKVTTIEGCPNIARIAETTFDSLQLKNIDLFVAEFGSVLQTLDTSDIGSKLVYIDGNHQYKPTVEYFNFFKKVLPENSILIFDDIYWSKEMKDAWLYIKSQPYFSIDLFKVGILILKKKSKPISIKKRF